MIHTKLFDRKKDNKLSKFGKESIKFKPIGFYKKNENRYKAGICYNLIQTPPHPLTERTSTE